MGKIAMMSVAASTRVAFRRARRRLRRSSPDGRARRRARQNAWKKKISGIMIGNDRNGMSRR